MLLAHLLSLLQLPLVEVGNAVKVYYFVSSDILIALSIFSVGTSAKSVSCRFDAP